MTSDQFFEPAAADERTDEVKAFFNQWHVYRTIMDHDYTGEVNAHKALRDLLIHDFPGGFSIIDLGCGDAGYMAQMLAGTPVSYYEGVDLSDVALDLARKNMEVVGCQCVFSNYDFVRNLQERESPVDVIWIGLSLHHLSSVQKEMFLAYCRSALTARGLLIIYEPMLEEGETREEFLGRCEAEIDAHWTALAPDEREAICEHVISADFPESVMTLREMGLRNGFARVESVWRNPTSLFQMIVFHASPVNPPGE
ncbi:MAG: L-histidine N(alpha)-methyltransferase [bacterium]